MAPSVADLDYMGARVRLKGDTLNLTDMWRAAGSDPQKQPAKWHSLPQASDFITYLADTLGKSESSLLFAKQGRGGGTFAHWQIGIAYAKYLSPAFHAWANSIIRAHMEDQASGTFEQRIINRLDRIQHQVETMDERIERLARQLPQRRREITRGTRILLADVTLALGGRCPCCSKAEVTDSDGNVLNAEFDHFYSNQLPSEDHSWLICKDCHDRLTTGTLSRDDAAVHFKSFQLRRVALMVPDDEG